MNKAVQLNQYANQAQKQKKEVQTEASQEWINNTLFPSLIKASQKGYYFITFNKKYSYEQESYIFEAINCPQVGINIDFITDLLQQEGFYIENNITTYFISWEDKYVY